MRRYDITLLQEIRDKTGNVVLHPFLDEVNRLAVCTIANDIYICVVLLYAIVYMYSVIGTYVLCLYVDGNPTLPCFRCAQPSKAVVFTCRDADKYTYQMKWSGNLGRSSYKERYVYIYRCTPASMFKIIMTIYFLR